MSSPNDAARRWIGFVLACAVLVWAGFALIDVPLARAALFFWQGSQLRAPIGHFFGSALLLSGEFTVLLVLGSMRLVQGRLSRFGQTLALACVASIVAYCLNDSIFKVLFGVAPPVVVLNGARHALHFGGGYPEGSFPSGHMALAGAFAGAFMGRYRASIGVLAALLALAAAMLVAGGWHFFSDVIAGTGVGVSAGILAALIYDHEQDGRSDLSGA